MSMNYQGPASEKSITEEEGVMFAATPVWDRNRKRKGSFGRKAAPAAAPAPTVAPEPRSFVERDDLALDAPVQRPLAAPPVADAYVRPDPVISRPAPSAETDGGMVAAIGRPSARTQRGATSKGMAPVALAAGVVALGAIGAVGWYATQGDDGIPEIAPGAQTEMAAAPLPPVVTAPETPADAAMAVNPPSAAAPPRTTVPSAPVRQAQAQARARPAAAAAPSAGDTAVNASATLPAGPQPYSTLNPGAAPPAQLIVPPAVAPTEPTTPTQAAPPPAEAPAAVPETPPTIPQTVPTEEPLTQTPPTAS